MVYTKEEAQTQWTSSITVPLPKKGDLKQMTNYRGISLMSIAAKYLFLTEFVYQSTKYLEKNKQALEQGVVVYSKYSVSCESVTSTGTVTRAKKF